MAKQLIPFKLKLTKEMNENLSEDYLNKLHEEFRRKGFDMQIERPKDRFFSKIQARVNKLSISSDGKEDKNVKETLYKQLEEKGIQLERSDKGDILGIKKDQKPLSEKEKKEIENKVPIASTRTANKEKITGRNVATRLLFDELKEKYYNEVEKLNSMTASAAKQQQKDLMTKEKFNALSEMGKAVRRGDYTNDAAISGQEGTGGAQYWFGKLKGYFKQTSNTNVKAKRG